MARAAAGRFALFTMAAMVAGCAADGSVSRSPTRTEPVTAQPTSRPGDPARRGDEIVICGRLVHSGTPVVLWSDAGGYDAYSTHQHFSPAETQPARPEHPEEGSLRYGARPTALLAPAARAAVAARGWTQDDLAQLVNKFVIHYDVCGTSRQCFRILHDVRGLSVHFLLDVDGTIYQTLDLKERAWHAGVGNDRSVGVEIAQIGAYPPTDRDHTLATWYRRDATGRLRVVLPAHLATSGVRTPGFIARPARDQFIRGHIQGAELEQADFTDEQYRALGHLAATLTRELPGIRPVCPRNPDGSVRDRFMPDAELEAFGGLVGHWHVSPNKTDPGPAFDWDRVIRDMRPVP